MLAPGMRRTAQRTMVYNAIVSLGGHCTADEIAEELHKGKPGFPRSTVGVPRFALTAALGADLVGDGISKNVPRAYLAALNLTDPAVSSGSSHTCQPLVSTTASLCISPQTSRR